MTLHLSNVNIKVHPSKRTIGLRYQTHVPCFTHATSVISWHNGGIITDFEYTMSNSSKSETIVFLGENIDKTNIWLEIFYSFCICIQHFQTKGCTWKDWNMFISTFVRSIHYIWKLWNKRTCKKKTLETDSSENVLWVFLVD